MTIVRCSGPPRARKARRAGVAVAVKRDDSKNIIVLRDAEKSEARDVAGIARLLPQWRADLAPDDAVAGEVGLVVRAPTQRRVVLELDDLDAGISRRGGREGE